MLETLLWTPDEGFFLGEKHLARMQDSADYFSFPFSVEKFDACLNQLAAWLTSPQRVRILLGRSGQLKGESTDFRSQEKNFKVRFAERPVHSKDVFLFHKTTQREIYPPVPADCDDLLLWNKNDELTEFTIGNLVVELDGSLFTPPISCVLLAGTFRAHLLDTGQIRERVIRKDELSKCTNLPAAGLFYLLFVGALVYVVEPAVGGGEIRIVILRGALFELVTYATYDLTNLATLRDWYLLVTAVDLIWGTVLTSTTSTLCVWLGRKL